MNITKTLESKTNQSHDHSFQPRDPIYKEKKEEEAMHAHLRLQILYIKDTRFNDLSSEKDLR